MLRGCRVVRGPDWASKDKDGGEGGLGTVVEVNPRSGKVKVIWDMGHESQAKAGHDAKFELRLYDNAPAGVVHEYISCDSCKQDPLAGIRWKCSKCEDFDLCTPCYMSNKHDISHPFFRFDTHNTPIATVPARTKKTMGRLHGILEGASVQRGIHWEWGNDDGGRGQTGDVQKLSKWGQNSYRGAVRVTWTNGTQNEYRVGGDGCVDVVSIGESQAHYYYPSHLPPFNAKGDTDFVLALGNKVRLEAPPQIAKRMLTEYQLWKPEYEDNLSKEGTVVEISHKGQLVWLAFSDAMIIPMVAALLSKVHVFSVGDTVQITSNFNAFQELQKGHGGYTERMDEALGKQGRVEEVDQDGDLQVAVGRQTWVLAPAVCTFVPHDQAAPSPGAPLTSSVSSVSSTCSFTSSLSSTSPLSSMESRDDEEVIAAGVERLLREFMTEEEGGDMTYKVDDLVEAAAQNDPSRVKTITAAKPDLVNQKMQGKTALQVACYQGHVDIVRLLLKVKADTNVPDNVGDNALHYAVAGENADVVKVLVEHNDVTVNALNRHKRTALHLAVTSAQDDVIHVLLNHGADPNTQDVDGDSPLHDAVCQNNDEIWKLLMRTKNLKLDVFNKEGHNPLHKAVIERNENAVEAILDREPALSLSNTKVELCSPLHIAALNGYTSIASIIISKGKGARNLKDGVGRTAMHLAVIKRSLQMVELLLHSGFDVNVQDAAGDTPSHLAWKTVFPSGTTSGLVSMRHNSEQGRSAIGDDHEIPYLLASRGANLELRNKAGKTPLDCMPRAMASLLRRVAQRTTSVARSDLSPPAKWVPMQNKKVQRLPLSEEDPHTSEEFCMVRDAFVKSLRFRPVQQIFRIQHLDAWERYATHKRKLERQYGPGQSGERYLFHGTRPATVDRIVNQGVDFRVVARAAYGDGAYFASDSKTSDFYTEADEQKLRYMFMVKVLAGEYCNGERGLKKPPLKEGSEDEHYDCCVDDVRRPRIYVIFDNAQCYPEYLIVYQ